MIILSPPAAAITGSSFLLQLFTQPSVYSGETKNDLRQGGEGKVAYGHWWGKTKTTDGLRSVSNPDSTSHNPVFTARMSTLHAGPDTPNDHSDLNLAELGIKRWLSNECCVSPWKGRVLQPRSSC